MERPQPRTDFHWGVYADATLAGLAVLIPIPLVDMAFEAIFRNRMPADIARSRSQHIKPESITLLNRSDESCLESCLMLPFKLVFELVKRLSKKLLYFLTVKDAVDRVSFYWQRAFLIDYALLLGHLNTPEGTVRAACAMDKAIQNSHFTALIQFARQLILSANSIRKIIVAVIRARFGRTDPTLEQERKRMAEQWVNFAGDFRALAARYDQIFEAECAATAAAGSTDPARPSSG